LHCPLRRAFYCPNENRKVGGIRKTQNIREIKEFREIEQTQQPCGFQPYGTTVERHHIHKQWLEQAAPPPQLSKFSNFLSFPNPPLFLDSDVMEASHLTSKGPSA
jgi:hypothetical protein